MTPEILEPILRHPKNQTQEKQQAIKEAQRLLSVAGVIVDFKNSEAFILTEREQEVLRLTAKGLTHKEIAKILFVSPRTVDHQSSSLAYKLGSNSLLQSVLNGIDLGLVDPSVIIKDLGLDTSSLEKLTPKEKNLLESIAKSRSTSSMLNGKNLSIKPRTVEGYSATIHDKLGRENPLPNIIPAVLLWMEAEKQGKV